MCSVYFSATPEPCEVGWKQWSPTDRVIYGLEDEDGKTTEGVVLAGVSGGSGEAGRADGDVNRSGGEAVVDTEKQPEQLVRAGKKGQLSAVGQGQRVPNEQEIELARRPEKGLVHHSDRGSQYCAHAYQRLLRQFGMQVSMSRKGNCWDNAPMENCWGSLKNEQIHHRRFATRGDAKR